MENRSALLAIKKRYDRNYNNIIIIGLLLVFIGLISCDKKEEVFASQNVVYDTIKPLSYFPAFPGSYWIYDNGDTLRIADQYQMFIFGLATGDPLFYDTLILPKIEPCNVYWSNGENGFVKGYELTAPSGVTYIPSPTYHSLLSTKLDSIFIYGPSVQGHMPMAETMAVDTVIYIGSVKYEHVIVTMYWDEACISGGYGNSPEDCADKREYYAKNIGLIKREHRYHNDTIFYKDFELLDYHIGL